MTEQLSFPLPRRNAQARSDFLVTEANATALAQIDHPWPQNKLLLIGPEASGKTHIATFTATARGAQIYGLADLPTDPPRCDVILEDVHKISGRAMEEAVFHLHNNILDAGHHLLLTARQPVHAWGLTLPDLHSRMTATATARIGDPDDALLPGLLLKLMADRQISPQPNVTHYLAKKMDRSYAAAMQIVDHLDQLALSERRDVTRALAARALVDVMGQA